MSLPFVRRRSFQTNVSASNDFVQGTAAPSMNAKAGDKLFGLDHLRSLAILLVFLFHYGRLFPHPEWTNTISKFGWTGVDLFFVLSGYLISSQLFDKIEKTGSVLFKRFFRIVPAYLLVVAVYFFFPYVHEREALAPLWKFLSFTQNLGLDLRTQGTFSHAWSLCIEEQFYLALPLMLFALVYFKALKKGFWLLMSLFLFGLAIRFYSYQTVVLPNIEEENVAVLWYKAIYYPTYCRLDGLLVGVGIAAMIQYKPRFSQWILKCGNLLLLLSILVLCGAYCLCLKEESFAASVFGFPAVSFGYGLMVLGAISPKSFLYHFKSSITTTVAALSYALYLVHKFVIHVAQDQLSKLTLSKDGNAIFVLCVLTVILFAFVVNRLIEKPFLKIRNRLLAVKGFK